MGKARCPDCGNEGFRLLSPEPYSVKKQVWPVECVRPTCNRLWWSKHREVREAAEAAND